MDILLTYFPDLTLQKKAHFEMLKEVYSYWNAQINVISRKDMDAFYERHVLHALGIANYIDFKSGSLVLDVGTGGGFPGIPLAIFFPEVQFYLIDSIGKKIKVVNAISQALDLKNVKALQLRAENFDQKVDFVVSRAVAQMDIFVPWIKKNISASQKNKIKNGLLYLKGGDLSEELKNFPLAQEFELSKYFNQPFFETKKLVYLPL